MGDCSLCPHQLARGWWRLWNVMVACVRRGVWVPVNGSVCILIPGKENIITGFISFHCTEQVGHSADPSEYSRVAGLWLLELLVIARKTFLFRLTADYPEQVTPYSMRMIERLCYCCTQKVFFCKSIRTFRSFVTLFHVTQDYFLCILCVMLEQSGKKNAEQLSKDFSIKRYVHHPLS